MRERQRERERELYNVCIYIYTQVRLSGVPGAVPVKGGLEDTDVTYSVTAME